jgi:hypothetical protein
MIFNKKREIDKSPRSTSGGRAPLVIPSKAGIQGGLIFFHFKFGRSIKNKNKMTDSVEAVQGSREDD